MPTVADVIVARLGEAGVPALVGMPGGGSNLDLLEAAGRAGLPFVLSHTETAGAIIASAQAELTGRPGACLATLGPGVSSLVNGAAHAYSDRVPLMLLTDRIPESGRSYLHQRLDHSALLAPVTKASVTIEADRADEQITRALAIATAAPPGPVHVDLAPDVSKKAAGRERGTGNGEREPRALGDVRSVREIVASARRPIVIAGLGVRDARDADAVRSFCEGRGIPVMVTYKAKGVVPDEHPLFAGVFTNGAIERPLVAAADLIIGVGLDPVEFLPRPWEYSAPCVLLSRWPLDDQRHLPVAGTLLGDLRDALGVPEECLPAATEWRSNEIAGHARRQRDALKIETRGWSPWRAVEAFAHAIGPDAQVTVDAGAHMFPITALWPVRRPRQMLISNGLSTMGYALPAAIGAALLDRRRRVVALTGDGGLLMCLAELGTAARERLPVTVVVFNDRSLSLIRIKQERLGYAPKGMALGGVNWQDAAATFGVPSWRAEGAHDVTRCVEGAAASGGPALIEAVIDPASYGETLRAVRG